MSQRKPVLFRCKFRFEFRFLGGSKAHAPNPVPSAPPQPFFGCLRLLQALAQLAALPLMIKGSRTQATSLHRTGLLNAVINRDLEEGIGRIDFSQREVAQFLARIEALEVLRQEIETVDLTVATKRTGFSTGQIMDAIFGGHAASHAQDVIIRTFWTWQNVMCSIVARVSISFRPHRTPRCNAPSSS
jgi:hypothetical protein